VAEPLLNVALLSHIQEVAPIEFGTPINLDNPDLLEYLLIRNKSTAVLAGLRTAYGNVGTGCLPSVKQLMNHCSGLPENLCHDSSILAQILGGAPASSSSQEAVDVEQVLGEAIGKHCRPMFAPGTQFHRSNLGTIILRMLLPGDGLSHVQACARELGVPTLCFPTGQEGDAPIRYAPSCPGICSPVRLQEPECPGYDIHTASCRIDELSQFFSGAGNNCKHSWFSGGLEGSRKYGFLSQMMVPKVCVQRQKAMFHG
jgi:hypothetical protein